MLRASDLMRGLYRRAVVLCLLALSQGPPLCGAPAPTRASAAIGPADTVVLVSIDGMRWDFPSRAGATSFERLRREGASAGGLVPPFPASTFPAHATLATGVFPDRHGIVNNRFLDRERGLFRREDDASWLRAEPLWVTAERQGVRSALYHWVCGSGAWNGTSASLSIPFAPGGTDSDAIERLIGWLDRTDADRPRLILSYLHGVDSAGHQEGPAAEAVDSRVRAVDRLIGRLMRSIRRLDHPTSLVVVSDHGMAVASRVHRLDRLLTGEARRVRSVSSGATSNLYCPDAAACAAASKALHRVAGLEVYPFDHLPDDLRYRVAGRTGDLVALAPPGTYFADGPRRGGPLRGMHGYGPRERDMWGIFFAWGAGVRPGARRDRLHSTDVVPLICRLMGLQPPRYLDGRVPFDLLEGDGVGVAHPASSRPGESEEPASVRPDRLYRETGRW